MPIKQQSKRGRPNLYPWDKWLIPGELTLYKGRHFNCETSTMVVLIHRQAKMRDLEVITKVRDRIITVMVEDAV
jgi:hypothetical protein